MYRTLLTTILLPFACSGNLNGIDQFPDYSQAEFYHTHCTQQTEVAFVSLEGLQFQGCEKVLDIGCGSGRITANVAGRILNGEIIGLDTSNGMIDFASKKHGPGLYPNLNFVCIDFMDTSYEEEFDLIISYSVLHWIYDHKTLVDKIYTALKPGGRIDLVIPSHTHPGVSQVMQEVLTLPEWWTFFAGYSYPRKKHTAEEYYELLAEQGFDEIDVSCREHTTYFDNKRELVDWFAAFSPLLIKIPEEKHQHFLEDIANHYVLTFPPQENGKVPLIQSELFIKAKK